MNKLLEDNSQVIGHIYLITNITINKCYVGQTLSHRKNRGKYRPFGYMGRFQDHISEAICNTKKKQCTYLNNAIRLYGKEAFHCELLTTCPKEELDTQEQHHIDEYKSLYPIGYNLTCGGKVFKNMETNDVEKTNPIHPPKKRGGCTSRSKETRAKMTERLKEVMGTPEARQEQMRRSQKQHSIIKLSKFKGVIVDIDNIEQYLHIRNNKDGSQFIKLVIGNKTTSFTGKYETLQELKQKAIEFTKKINQSATLPNCSGNP
jgi:hypothetical protein